MGLANQWSGRHDDQCEDPDFNNSIQCLCLDRFIDARTATPHNLHVLIVTEADLAVLKVAYSTHKESLDAWREFVIQAAEPNTLLDEELRRLAGFDEGEDVTIEDVVADLSDIDLIDWWTTRDRGNAARLYEVQDKR
jgi:hypothetical protein